MRDIEHCALSTNKKPKVFSDSFMNQPIKLFALTALITTTSLFTYAQNYSVQNSADFLIKGYEFHEKEAYKSAIREYQKVHRNDTNYALALYEMSLSQIKDENYRGAMETCKKGLELNSVYQAEFFRNFGTSYSELKMYDSAINLYNRGIKLFPFNSSLRYNKAVSEMRADRYDEAMETIYANLRMNPYHANSHLMLGNICMAREWESQALMSYLMYLMVQSNSEANVNVLIYVDRYVGGTMDGDTTYSKLKNLEQGYQDIDELIRNKFSFNKKFKVESKLKEPIVKQSYLLLSSLSSVDSDEEGFWNEYYKPFFEKLYKDGVFEGMSYYLMRNLDPNSKIGKTVRAKQSKTNAFLSWYSRNFTDLFGMHEKEDGSGKIEYHYENSNLIGIGEYTNSTHRGYWQFYNKSGSMSTEGNFKNDKQDGTWKTYNHMGVLSQVINYSQGNLNGDYESYNDHGVLVQKGTFKDNLFDGDVKYYYQTGGIRREVVYKNGVLNGPVRTYHQNGKLYLEGTYKDDKLNGLLLKYFPSGQMSDSMNYENDLIQGIERRWYDNGNLSYEAAFKDGKYDGFEKIYFENGKLKRESRYKDNKLVGESSSYYNDGSLLVKNVLDETGKISGVSTTYYPSGEKLSDEEYKKGDLIKYSFYSKEGKVLSKGEKTGKAIEYKGYNTRGYMYLQSEMQKGELHGKRKLYYPNKILKATENFKEGVSNGTIEYFYNLGQVKTRYKTVDGLVQGDYVQFSKDGKVITTEGYYVDDERQGEYIGRNSAGVITSKSYYDLGELHGWQIYYGQDGRITSEIYYEHGDYYGGLYYDTMGHFQKVWLDNGNGLLELKYPNGQTRVKLNYKNGVVDGEAVWYNADGKISTKGQFVNDKRHGEWIWYFENGQESQRINYLYGDRHGKGIEYFKNGKLQAEYSYLYGDLDGKYTEYFDNGKVMYEEYFEEGLRQGNCKYYVPTGDLAIIRRYIDNFLVGYSYLGKDGKAVEEIPVDGERQTVTAYFQNGKKSIEFTIEKDEYDGEYTYYYPTGKIFKTLHYDKGWRSGDIVAYYSDGTMWYKGTYVKDEYNGTFVRYYTNGKTDIEFTYVHGELNGLCKYYNNKGALTKTRYYFDNTFYGGEF